MNSDQPRFPPIFVLFFGVLGISSGSILVRLAQGEAMPSLVIAAWRLTLASAVLLPFAMTRRRTELRQLAGASWRLAILSGFMLALHFASWISSLAYTSVASSTVLVTTSPLWVGLTAPFLLGERLSRPLKVGIALAMVGSVLIGIADVVALVDGRFQFSLTQFTNQPNPLLGNGLALIGAVAASAYLIIGRRLRPNMSLLSYTAVVYGTAALFLILFALLAGYNLFGYSATAYLVMMLMALFPQLIGHSSYNWALGYLSAAYVSVAVIAEPIGATALALLIFQEVPNWLTILGSILLLGGIVYASRPERKTAVSAP
ncbi:MAG: DMT family transporter [Ardenticatenaceae bacterium]|nr:DMT family transporter [Ardenticatenaceae bacterium]